MRKEAMIFLVQRIFHGQGKDGSDVRDTLLVGISTADAALAQIKDYFEDDQEFKVSYNATTKRFSVKPEGRPELEYHIVKRVDESIIDEVITNGTDTKSE